MHSRFDESCDVGELWKSVPGLIELLKNEMEVRLDIRPEVLETKLVLSAVDPALTFGTNFVIFTLFFPKHPGMIIHCESCLEHPAAMISVKKHPHEEDETTSAAIRTINKNCVGYEFEANLLNMKLG